MARAIWTGVISFGLVSVPVALYSATAAHEVSFHQFQKGTDDRIRYKRVNERTGREVDYDKIVKGAQVSGGHYVLLEQDELDAVAPGRSRSLEIDRFVELTEIDPIFFAKTYYLGPPDDDAARVYGLLRDAMARTGRAAIGKFVMRGKEYLVTVRADGDLLVLHTMFFADEVRDPQREVDNLPPANPKAKELKMAEQLISSMTGEWDPAAFRDTYTDAIKKLIKAKGKGREVAPAAEAPAPTNVVDLMDVLRRSVDASKGARAPAKSTSKKAQKRPAQKKSARKKRAQKAAARKTAAKPAAKKAAAHKASGKRARTAS